MARTKGLVDAGKQAPRLLVKLKYSTTDNFLKKDVYGDLERCYLQRDAARMLARAAKQLARQRPDLRLLAYDCARPLSVQRQMWKLVKGTREQPYVANPRGGSMHNLGCAVDLTLARADGRPLSMGTPFDFTGRRAQPRLERKMVLAGKLSSEQWANRLLLRQVMVQAGFIPLAIEWWHFDCATRRAARKSYRQIP
jgi:zinc D-Ala-D-Ala dipeptidase